MNLARDAQQLSKVLVSGEFEETSNIGFIGLDAQGQVYYANPAACEILDATLDELRVTHLTPKHTRVVREDGSTLPLDEYPSRITMSKGIALSDVILGIDVHGRVRRWLSATTTPLFKDGRIDGAILTYVDATERVRRERELALIHDMNLFASTIHTSSELLQHLCDILVTRAGYALAWVGIPSLDDPYAINVDHSAGQTRFLEEISITVDPSSPKGDGPTARVLRSKTPIIANYAQEIDFLGPWASLLKEYGFASGIAIPIDVGRPAVLCLLDTPAAAFDEEVLRGLESLVREVELAIKHRHAMRDHALAFEGTLHIIAGLTETRDPYTEGHQIDVGSLSGAIAREMGLDEEMATLITQAGQVHDVGKIAIPAEILTRPGRLTDLEYQMVQTHSRVGYELLMQANLPWPIPDVALQHHERLDGSGYPDHRVNGDIILPARIVAVADVVEAMAHHRPYRAALGLDVALAEVTAGAGTLFDADVVAACLKVIEEGYLFPHVTQNTSRNHPSPTASPETVPTVKEVPRRHWSG